MKNGCLRALYHVHVMDRRGWRQFIILLESFDHRPTARCVFFMGAVDMFLGEGGWWRR